jgi:hypothetical protein
MPKLNGILKHSNCYNDLANFANLYSVKIYVHIFNFNFEDTTTIFIKALLKMTLLITIINATLHTCVLPTIITLNFLCNLQMGQIS